MRGPTVKEVSIMRRCVENLKADIDCLEEAATCGSPTRPTLYSDCLGTFELNLVVLSRIAKRLRLGLRTKEA